MTSKFTVEVDNKEKTREILYIKGEIIITANCMTDRLRKCIIYFIFLIQIENHKRSASAVP